MEKEKSKGWDKSFMEKWLEFSKTAEFIGKKMPGVREVREGLFEVNTGERTLYMNPAGKKMFEEALERECLNLIRQNMEEELQKCQEEVANLKKQIRVLENSIAEYRKYLTTTPERDIIPNEVLSVFNEIFGE